VPEVLCGGDHAAIRKWRREQALLKTMHNRPDLLKNADLSPGDRKFLDWAARTSNKAD
jgi:tRNA (guanine37-N1)-methyltransferase